MNGDGFGVGWYHTNVAICPSMDAGPSADGTRDIASNGAPPPTSSSEYPALPVDSDSHTFAAVFKDIYPAWNNMNLREICMATSSHCIMAHVRAASKNTGVSHQNCHPFKAGRLLFCHNGRIDQFSLVRRRFLATVSDEAFNHVRGTTDSEVIFALILTALAKDGTSPIEQEKPFGHQRLVKALKSAIMQIEDLLGQAGLTEGYSTCNFSLTDGETMVVTRYCDKSPDIPPPSLYFAYGTAKSLYQELTSEDAPPLFDSKMSNVDSASDISTDSDEEHEERVVHLNHESRPGKQMVDVDPAVASFIVASNPLTKTHTWHPMPRNSIMWCSRGFHPELRLLRRSKSVLPKEMNY
jgi:predicted glutamine amidotransferase